MAVAMISLAALVLCYTDHAQIAVLAWEPHFQENFISSFPRKLHIRANRAHCTGIATSYRPVMEITNNFLSVSQALYVSNKKR